MWYKLLSEYLIKEGCINYPIYSCVSIKKFESRFSIVAVYLDNMNLIGIPKELFKIAKYLKEFEIKNLDKIKFCFGLELENKENGILIHKPTYIRKVLKRFNMDKSHLLSSPMVVQLLKL